MVIAAVIIATDFDDLVFLVIINVFVVLIVTVLHWKISTYDNLSTFLVTYLPFTRCLICTHTSSMIRNSYNFLP